MAFWRKSILWQLLLPVPLVVVLLVAGWAVLPGVIRDNAVDASIASAQQTVNQFKTLRAYYTKNIIKKVVADGNLKPSVTHQNEAESIPLPATLIHDMSEMLAEQDTKLRLYSNFPFPNRSSRELDAFQSEAWAFLNNNPDEIFVREVDDGSDRRVRVAVADRMVAEVCVACHNSHPASPKTNWRLNDVRGVLEVDAVIEPQLAAGQELANNILFVGFSAAFLLAGCITISARRQIRPILEMDSSVAALAKGERAELETDRQDEIGRLSRSMEQFYIKGLEAARLRAALDSSQINVMVANRRLDVIYINPSLTQLFKTLEPDFRKDLPQFSADKLLGSNIDIFHKNPAHQRAILENLHGMHTANIEIGSRKLALVVNPILDTLGDCIGTVVEWQDRTAELAALQEIDDVIAAANRGDLDRRLRLEGKDGFMLSLSKGINELTGVVDEVTGEIGSMLEGMAQGDLSQKIASDYQGKFGELQQNANNMVDQLIDIVGQIRNATGEVENAASEISSGTEDLSQRTEQAASNIEETAASTEQMSATVKQNADSAKSASDLADTADRSAKTGGEVVEQAVSAMAEIESSAQKITDIIGVIDEIAFQTNLLALNASVEAARAGEAGKGFAVVAQEVRQLAQRSAQAADDIKALIKRSNGQVKNGVELVNRAGEALAEIVGSIGKVTTIVDQISNASQEQAAGVQEINSSITSMDEMTQQNSALVEESSAAARALSDQAGKLNKLMTFFKNDGVASFDRQQPRTLKKNHSHKASTSSVVHAGDNEGWDEF